MLLNALRAAQIEPTALGPARAAPDADSPSWAWQADKPLNPASLVKLITSAAALDTLGPAWQWQTPVWLQGTLDEQGRLDGTLTIQGSGDPRLGIEPLNTALRRLQTQLGLREVRGPLVLDRSAFAPTSGTLPTLMANPGAWAMPSPRPAAASQVHHLQLPARGAAGASRPSPRSSRRRPCRWRAALWRLARGPQARLEPGPCALCRQLPAGLRRAGLTLADPDPASYPARLLTQLAHEQGLALGRGARGPSAARAPTLRIPGPTVAEAVRDMNKHSSNLMAQQLLLSLARAAGVAPVNGDTAAAWLQTWFDAHGGAAPAVWPAARQWLRAWRARPASR